MRRDGGYLMYGSGDSVGGVPPLNTSFESKVPYEAKWNERSIRMISNMLDQMQAEAGNLAVSTDGKAVAEFSSLARRFSEEIGHLAITGEVIEISARRNIDARIGELVKVLGNKSVDLGIDQLRESNRRDLEVAKELAGFHRLWNAAKLDVVDNEVRQIQVISQTEATKGAGFELCGYHALKNALIAACGNNADVQKMLNDKTLFDVFFKRYCSPELKARGLDRRGERDATFPTVMAVIERIKCDQKVPKELQPLREALDIGHCAVLQIATENGELEGPPMIGLFDAAGAKQILKLAEFAKHPGPATLSLVCGNESFGHWYTLVVHKSDDGSLRFLGMDSNGDDHEILGTYSPLAKLSSLLSHELQNPSHLVERAYEPLEDFIGPRAAWVSEGVADSAKQLVNLKPDEAYGNASEPKRSYCDWVLDHCETAMQVAEVGRWLDSGDYEYLHQLSRLKTVVDYLVANLPKTHPRYESLGQLSTRLNPAVAPDLIEQTVVSTLADFQQMGSRRLSVRFTPSALERSRRLFTSLLSLNKRAEELAKIVSAVDREHAALDTVLGVEPGMLGEGDTERARLAGIMRVIDLPLCVYARAKRRDKLAELVRVVGNGDGCLTATLGRLEEFFAELSGLGHMKDRATAEAIALPVHVALSGMINGLVDPDCDLETEQCVEKIRSLRIEDIFPEHLALFAENLETFSRSKTGAPFRDFLVARGICKSAKPKEIDWGKASPKILNLPEMQQWYARARIMAEKDARM